MVLDTSAIIAILLLEPEAEAFAAAIKQAPTRLISAGTLLELNIVTMTISRKLGPEEAENFIVDGKIAVIPFDEEQIVVARDAYRRYGRGRHRAGLNFGDCFAYALAKVSGETLLCKGDDFARTDIAIWRAADERR